MLKFTSIFHCERSNYQVDFCSPGAPEKFNNYCVENKVLWGRLFSEETGELVVQYYKNDGFSWNYRNYNKFKWLV